MINLTKKIDLSKITYFIRRGAWEMPIDGRPWHQLLGIHSVRLISLVVNGFRKNQCALHAASLTFFSLTALVPVLALTLALARAFGGADKAREQFNKSLDSWIGQMEPAAEVQPVAVDAENTVEFQTEVTRAFSSQVREIADQLFDQVNSINFGTLGGVGAVMLIVTAVGLLSKIEASFNQVWAVDRPRSQVRRFADYLLVIILLPFLATAASTVPVVSIIVSFTDKTLGGPVTSVMRGLLESGFFKLTVTTTLGAITFAFLQGFMPNARVKTIPALISGLVTMLLFAIWLQLCAKLQIGIAKYSALYGGFAVLPILLFWVYISWQIILLGSEIAFAIQNRDTYVLEQNAANASLRSRILLALAFCAEAARAARTDAHGGPFDANAFARQHRIPYRFAMDILEDLARNKILARVADPDSDDLYLPYRNSDTITVADVIRVVLDDGEPLEALGLNHLSQTILEFSHNLDNNLVKNLTIPVAQTKW